MKGRLDRGEGTDLGRHDQGAEHRQGTMDARYLGFGLLAGLGTLIGIVGVVVAVVHG